MRHLLRAFAVMLSVLALTAGVAYAQAQDATLEDDLVTACEEAGGRMQDGTCLVSPGNWCGFEDSPRLCDPQFGGRWLVDPVLLEDMLGENVEPEPVTAAEPATPTPGAPTYTG